MLLTCLLCLNRKLQIPNCYFYVICSKHNIHSSGFNITLNFDSANWSVVVFCNFICDNAVLRCSEPPMSPSLWKPAKKLAFLLRIDLPPLVLEIQDLRLAKYWKFKTWAPKYWKFMIWLAIIIENLRFGNSDNLKIQDFASQILKIQDLALSNIENSKLWNFKICPTKYWKSKILK